MYSFALIMESRKLHSACEYDFYDHTWEIQFVSSTRVSHKKVTQTLKNSAEKIIWVYWKCQNADYNTV